MQQRSIDELLEVFNSSGYFREYSVDTLTRLMGFTEIKTLSPGETILREGEPNETLYFLLSGKFGVFVRNGRVATVRRRGDVLGELSLLTDKACTATVVAEAPSEVLCINIKRLEKDAPEEFFQAQKSQFLMFAAALAEKLVNTNEIARKFEKANAELEALNANLESKIQERTQQITEQNQKLEKAVSENRSLLRILCHDLNNTVSVNLLTAEKALKEIKMHGMTSNSNWERIHSAAVQEHKLISLVRKLSAMEADNKHQELFPVRLRETLNLAQFLFQSRLDEKLLTLVETMPEDLSVMAEPVTFSHSVINNLISNAIKFSNTGGKIYIDVKKKSEKKVQITIRDQGIGIPQSLLTHLFTHDMKTTRPGTQGEEGTGFGMSLVKTCLEAYGGSIQIESVCAEDHPHSQGPTGTTITLELQLAR